MMYVTDRDFDKEVLDCKLPVFACFTAHWCHTCYPTCLFADQLVEKYDGRVRFVRVDIEKSSEIAERYHIIPVPTILLFQDSQPVKKLVGFHELKSLRALLNGATAEGKKAIAPIR
ncbi:MAG TPA: thioredoxin [Dehalococcoidia bacterium]|nr:thioredoxin [Dehalococcoidia bacterium]